jgi:hypothetical protein
MTVNPDMLRLYQSWRQDWCKFAHEALKVRLDREQRNVLRAVQTEKMVSVASGNSRGKDFVAAVAGISCLYLTPKLVGNELVENTKVAMTAPTDRQVKNIMVPEITRLFLRLRGLPGYLVGYDIRTPYKEWFLTGFKASQETEAWTGFHAVHTMFIVTEASGFDERIFDSLEGNLTGNSRLLIVFNPNRSTGYAARSQISSRWKSFRLDSLNAENVVKKRYVIPGQVDYEWVKDKVQSWCTPISENDYMEEEGDFHWEGSCYRPNDLFRIKVRGMFPKESEDVLVPLYWIESAQRRWKEHVQGNGHPTGQELIGVDVAGMGNDMSVLCHRYGDFVKNFDATHSGGRADHMKIVGKLVNPLKKGALAFIDTIGEGAGVYSRCVEQNLTGAVSCKFSEAAKTHKGKPLNDIHGVYEFANMRAYLYWAVRDWLDPKNGSTAMLPDVPEIAEELSEIRYFFRSDGKIQIESREDIILKLKRSPDYSVSLANTFYPAKISRKERMNKEQLSNLLP